MCVSEKHSLFTTEHNCKDKIFKLYFKIDGILYEKNIDNGKNLYQKKTIFNSLQSAVHQQGNPETQDK